jgi:hypothetical protein
MGTGQVTEAGIGPIEIGGVAVSAVSWEYRYTPQVSNPPVQNPIRQNGAWKITISVQDFPRLNLTERQQTSVKVQNGPANDLLFFQGGGLDGNGDFKLLFWERPPWGK